MPHSKKVVLLGHFGVGKTSLIRRFIDDAFHEDYLVTVGVHVKKKVVSYQNEEVTLIIWDIEGKTSVADARKSYLLGSHGFIYVFDVSRPETFQQLNEEISQLEQMNPEVPVCILGNKKDLLTPETQQIFASVKFEKVIFTSAKEGENVAEAFDILTSKMVSS